MKNQLGIFVSGANGKMGKHIIKMVIADQGLQLVGASENADSPVLGADAGLNAGLQQISVSISKDLKRALEKNRGVIIDFSSVANTLDNIKRAVEYNTPIIIGTTGFSPEQHELIISASQKVAVLFSPNMSVGMNVFFKLIREAAKFLNSDYDIEVIEAHHRAKVDAPSGTALKIARILCETTKRNFPDDVTFARKGQIGPRKNSEIGVQVIRAGDIVGDHTVLCCGNNERIEIKHMAHDRSTFASGAILAAKWIKDKPAGLYDMEDVLGI